MNFYLIGVDYQSAPPKIRQRLYSRRSQIESFWSNITMLDSAILVTCNRFDISIAARMDKEFAVSLERFKKEFPEFYAHSYIKETGSDVLRYGLRLACGLKSQLKGEFQILEQLQAWLVQRKFSKSLFEFWSQIIKSASEIRFKSGLYTQEINIAKLLFTDLNDLVFNNGQLEMAVVGTGKLATLLAEYRPDNVRLSFVAHKNRLKAEALANRVGGKVLSFDQLKVTILNVHVLVSVASSPHVILRSEDIPDSVLQRDKPLCIYDLGFPANVSKELGYRKNIILKNIDDLISSVKNTNDYFRKNFNLAEYLIEETVRENEHAQSGYAAKSVSD